MFKGLFQFLKSKTFLKHIIIYSVVVGLLIWGLLSWLGSTTNHGETIKVPDFTAVKIADLDKFVADKSIRYLVIDSVYDTKSKPGIVIKQEPESNAEVKEGRTIYLYVTSILPPSIQMPKLVDRSLRQAAAMITSYGLKLGRTKFIPDQCANCVLDQLVKGKRIEPGATISKGTVIDLVVGKGLSDEEVAVPCLYGLTRRQALEKLTEASLSIGIIRYDEPKDSVSAKVYRQSPNCGKEANINMGSTVDLFLTTNKNKIPSIDTTSSNKNNDENFDN
ncbi:MAG: PASTA domain-containing protein [Bacteroidota bacterium]